MTKLAKIYSLIVGSGLRDFKYRNSHLKPVGYSEKSKGSIFGFREKELLKVGRGVIMTSLESLVESGHEFTHWTPNVYRYGKKLSAGIVEGYSEDNLRQINTFVIDIDDKKVDWTEILLKGLDSGFMPTMILETVKGYQVYFALSKPAFINKHTDFKVIKVAKRISSNLRKYYADRFNVDLGCNDFGIFRIPGKDNVLYFDASNCYSFNEWLQWSYKREDALIGEKKPVMHLVKSENTRRQIDEPWFDLLLNKGNIHGQKGILGRNNAILTLALAFFSSGKTKENCEYNLEQFNDRLEAPLKSSEVQRIINSAYSEKYKAAQRGYIVELLQTWVDPKLQEQDLFLRRNGWYKFAKPRAKRKNSHFSELENDLLVYLRKKCTVDKPYLTCTAKELTAEIGMSLSSFKVVKKRLGAKNKIKFSSTKGRNGRTTLVLIEIFVVGVMSKKKALKSAYINSVAELINTTTTQLKRVVATFTKNDPSLNISFNQLELLEVNTS